MCVRAAVVVIFMANAKPHKLKIWEHRTCSINCTKNKSECVTYNLLQCAQTDEKFHIIY